MNEAVTMQERLQDTEELLRNAKRLFVGIVRLDGSILDNPELTKKAYNFAREEYGLLPDEHIDAVKAYRAALERGAQTMNQGGNDD